MSIMTTKRDALIGAAKTLLWEKGYQATSPKDIQAFSNAGQGSFYHHFKGKKDLAAKALQDVSHESITRFEEVFGDSGSIIARLTDFLLQPKDALTGCRMGRMVWDSAVRDDELRQPIENYFKHLESRIVEALEAAIAEGEIRPAAPPKALAAAILAVIQGAFTLSRAMQDPDWYDRAVQGAVSLLTNTLTKDE